MYGYLRNIKTNDIYKYYGDGVFENLRTGDKGKIPDHIAQANLKINLELTEICNQYPLVEELIRKMELIIDK